MSVVSEHDQGVSSVKVAIVKGDDAGREFSVSHALLLGRDPQADVLISDLEVSTKHASLAPHAGGIAIEDLGSTNGTFVNGQRITSAQPLNVGDQIQLGETVLEVRGPKIVTGDESLAPSPQQLTRARQIPTVPLLVFVAGPLAGSNVPVGGPVVIGRDPGTADVILESDTDVSRRHATFSPAGDGITVQDLGSTNGTLVNGQRIAGTVTLNTGDRVEIGETVIDVLISGRVVTPPAPAPVIPQIPGQAPNTIEVQGLVKQFGSQRAVDGINLFVNPGEIYGFLGPNGAGKSTTVHMLVTLLPPSGGTARIAGFDVVKQDAKVRATIGVALQAAALDGQLNSWEHMDLQMALQGVPRRERSKRRKELIERVGLTYAADRRVGGYSGGMKRRLDLALALVHSPRVLFLDEPTTGLDPQSRTALWEEVARLVREEGMTVFLTTQYLEEADVLADRVGIIDHGEIVAEDTPARLKEEIGRPTVEVTPAEAGDTSAISGVLERFGDLVSAARGGVAVRLRPGVEGLADVIRALDAQRLKLANVELHAPTLDDVFLIKTGRPIEAGGTADGAGATPE
jgi:ABC-2 type transport system ATP-binding protein